MDEIILEALSNDDIKNIIMGTKKDYRFFTRRDDLYGMQAFDSMLKCFDRINKAHPELGLKGKYEQGLLDLLNTNIGRSIFFAIKCLYVNMELEEEENFDFKLNNKEILLKAAKSAIIRAKENLMEVIAYYSNPGVAEDKYTNLSNQIDESIGSISM
jgi:hypothetical protein